MKKLKIQFIAADTDPGRSINIPAEYQEILRAVNPGSAERHKLLASPAARLDDVIKALESARPNCVHFSAHGTQFSRIILFDKHDKPEPISHQTIGLLFHALRDKIRLVTLSYCYSKEEARKIAELIDCVIGIEKTITPEAANAYAASFYGRLADGKSVGRAHELALVEFAKFELPPESQPILITREGVDAHAVLPSEEPHNVRVGRNKRLTEHKQAFEHNQKKYKIWADELSITKTCLRDGSSVLTYEIRNLQCSQQLIEKIYFHFESVAGLVSTPRLDARGKSLNLDWKSDPASSLQTIRGVIDQIRTISGHFVGKLHFSPADHKGRGYTFSWTIPVINSEAVTNWEYNNLYPSKLQAHVDGRKLRPMVEYFASLTWFPVKRLSVQLNIPEAISENPRPQHFQLKKKKQRSIPEMEVLKARTLYLCANPKSRWRKANARWELAANSNSLEMQNFRHESNGCNTLIVDYPMLGSYYSIDWDVPERNTEQQFYLMISEAEVVREQLIAHRNCREADKRNPQSEKVAKLFLDLHNDLRKKFGSNHHTEQFETTLLTWDEKKKRLVVVEGFINGKRLSEKAWDFWLPFGLGLGGACFRKAAAQVYRQPLDTNGQTPRQNYLRLPYSTPHACLLTLHIDHPSLNQSNVAALGAFRSRQLIGVITVGSTFRASSLCSLCDLLEIPQFPQADGNVPEVQKDIQEIGNLRNVCQAVCDNIFRLLMNRAESNFM